MSKKKKTDTNVSEKKEEDFLGIILENQFTQQNVSVIKQRNLKKANKLKKSIILLKIKPHSSRVGFFLTTNIFMLYFSYTADNRSLRDKFCFKTPIEVTGS